MIIYISYYSDKKSSSCLAGNHGYDNIYKSMHVHKLCTLEWGISGELNLRGNNLFLIQTQSLFFDARHFFARVSASRRNKVVLIYVNGGHYGYVHIQLG